MKMKKSELQHIIQEEIQKILAEESVSLKLGGTYQVYDPGMDEWNSDYEYLGLDSNSGEHMFRAAGAPGEFYFVGIPQSNLSTDVK